MADNEKWLGNRYHLEEESDFGITKGDLLEKAMRALDLRIHSGGGTRRRKAIRDGQISYEDSEAILKPRTDWDKASFGRLTASNDEDFIHLMLTFSWFQAGQILLFCSIGGVVVGIQVMKTTRRIGLRYMKECLTQKLILLGAQLLILTLSSATSSSACLDFSYASAVKLNILHSLTKVLEVKTMNLGGPSYAESTDVGLSMNELCMEEQVSASTKTFSSSQSQLPQVKEKGKGKMVEPKVPLKKKDHVVLDEEIARNLEAQLQAELIKEERLTRKKEEEANIASIESWDNIQAMMKADFELAQRLQAEEQG
ncbi:hypothetical protein Tco_0378384 [Tanacetum coccineum]